MENRTRVFAAAGLTVAMFLFVQLGALALVEPFQQAGYQQVENPSDPTNSLVYVAAVLVLTGVMLAIIKLDVQWLLRGALIFTSGLLSWYVFSVVIPAWVVVQLGGAPLNLAALAAAATVSLALAVHPEWYVIDAAGVLMGAGAAGLFGISFGLLPAVLLLTVLAVYDAISVYGTEHMLTLASGVMDLKIPVILVIPMTLSYSFLDDDGMADGEDAADAPDETETASAADGGETPEADAERAPESDAHDEAERPDVTDRDVFFIGLGDAVMPTVMVASAASFAPPESLISGFALNLPALTSMVGTIAGLLVLLWMVMKGRAHAGLPLLNGGAIGGYLVGALASGMTLMQALGL
ncbi:presenilin family intramembrane aspartyl protease [Halorussus gelatinilyticus]|uniref:Presenilin family intramembrane aspartyl protease n=1 Tax=Halorussus gelatinilyticus TaxID=2937524 RepID=A0A8U0IF93_9EURY|nr:presenilin family intramembrane aspartyl protease PSH [Halorussus gelatinilyticus]UPV99414.1 presenilin family intramembrane aspartyl protease [Halorussus gelatinilyticus]